MTRSSINARHARQALAVGKFKNFRSYCCTQCGGTTVVTNSRRDPNGRVRRRRECIDLSCAHRFSTLEVEVQQSDPIRDRTLGRLLDTITQATTLAKQLQGADL